MKGDLEHINSIETDQKPDNYCDFFDLLGQGIKNNKSIVTGTQENIKNCFEATIKDRGDSL